MKDTIELSHERVDDIPLIIGLAQQLHLPEILDHHLGNHGHHQGVSNGWLTTIWLAYILTEGDHRKSSVQDWVDRHQHTLEQLVQQPLRAGECNDDRLGIVLRRLSCPAAWQGLEAELWASTVTVYEVAVAGVRLDSTTTCGYHTSSEAGLMQYGHSKGHRPDLAQVKLMAAAAQPSGHLLACDVYAGQRADDPLYQPLITRVRHLLGRTELLYAGDSKMAALATRADIVAHGDFYLIVPGHTSWPQNGPFDANLAHLISRNTAFLRKDTTHKTPQSAEPFAFWLSFTKSVSSSSTQAKWPVYGSQSPEANARAALSVCDLALRATECWPE